MTTLYLGKAGVLEGFVQVVLKYLSVQPKIEYIDDLPEESKACLLKLSPTKTLPLLKVKDSLITGVFPILNYLISSEPEETKKCLLGCDQLEISQNEMFLNYIMSSICPITNEIFLNLKGKKMFNKAVLDEAVKDLIEELDALNSRLKFRTFLLAHSAMLCDIFLACTI